MFNPKTYHFAVAMLVLVVTTAVSMALLSGGFYLLLKSVSKDEASFAFGFLVLFPSLGLLFVVSIGLGLCVSHIFYRRVTSGAPEPEAISAPGVEDIFSVQPGADSS